MVAPVLKTAGNGCWILNGSLPNAFISSDDSLFIFDPGYNSTADTGAAYRIAMLIGEVEGKTLGVFFQHKEPGYYMADFYLVDLRQSPVIDLSKAVKVEFSDYDDIYHEYLKLRHLSGNFYIANSDYQGLSIYSFNGSRFELCRTVLEDEIWSSTDYWEFRNGRLIYGSKDQVVYRQFNPSDTSFSDKKAIITLDKDDEFDADLQWKYAALLKKDILDIYDLDKGTVINTIALTGVTSPRMPIIDSPYVFLHQVKRTVDVKESKGSGTPEAYNMLTAYPNPFNGLAKIRYTLAKDQAMLEVKVYDVLGRVVKSLYSGPASRGEHEQYFEANDLPTGVYIYSVESPELRMTNKLMLLK